jgi:protein SCO1/2
MARKSYLAVKLGKSELYDMVHTENFVLVDAKRRGAWFYDGTNKEDIKKLIIDINFLSNEYAEKKVNAFYLFNTKSLIFPKT